SIYALSTASNASGNVVVAGVFTGTVDFDPGPGTRSLSASSGGGFVAEYTADGKLVWIDQVNATVSCVAMDSTGHGFAVGCFTGNASFAGTAMTANAGTVDAFVWKLTTDGSTTWVTTAGAPSLGDSARAFGVAVDAAGDVAVTGDFSTAYYDDTYYNPFT